MQNNSTTKTISVKIFGRVQGVGFRSFVEQNAKTLEIVGFVRNSMDGTVEAEFQGTEEQLEQILILCHKGPTLSHVEKITKTTVPDKEYTSFEVTF